MSVKGYKCFNKDLTCRGFQFEAGRSYTHAGPLKLCESGFHFHEDPSYLFVYYQNHPDTIVCEVSCHEVISSDDKSVCRTIEVIRRLSYREVCKLIAMRNGDGAGDGAGAGDGDGAGAGAGACYGAGAGDGDGLGEGDGNGDGYGDGLGEGDGYGYGDGNGDGYGYGAGGGKYYLPYYNQKEIAC